MPRGVIPLPQLSLYALMHSAKEVETPGWTYNEQEFKEWCTKKAVDIPMFNYWITAFNLELAILSLVDTLRKSLFQDTRRHWQYSFPSSLVVTELTTQDG